MSREVYPGVIPYICLPGCVLGYTSLYASLSVLVGGYASQVCLPGCVPGCTVA